MDELLFAAGDAQTLRERDYDGEHPDGAQRHVPVHRPGAAGSVFLPFEEDGGTLSVILSKAFFLVDDTAITDPTITPAARLNDRSDTAPAVSTPPPGRSHRHQAGR
ncbi:hypothetical protein Acor_24840 [Acrocarpospora corrugata]|uniref:DUF7737 domain-containing protein n=1 Tax=Acrocarpospora corrugata TaxID=35763 RepID=A0A5M3VWU3_9ACTN|nr:hypothetical protein [Acrocarpospora corrugata]GES00420.1 hypothetical protein Acor_24840 [Acrocarpospora corrugata]